MIGRLLNVSRLGMQLFRALRANVGITCVDVTLRNVTGRELYSLWTRARARARAHVYTMLREA